MGTGPTTSQPSHAPRSSRCTPIRFPENDRSRELARKHGFTIYPTIKDALTLGGDDLAVDAACLIGEHGDYPSNERGQKLYPRYEMLEQHRGGLPPYGQDRPGLLGQALLLLVAEGETNVPLAKRPRVPDDDRLVNSRDGARSLNWRSRSGRT